MKSLITLNLIIIFGMLSPLKAQEYASAGKTQTGDMTTNDPGAGEETTMFDGIQTAGPGCSMIRNLQNGQKVYVHKNRYEIVTENEEETVIVIHRNDGGRKLAYANDFESLRYHLTENGKVHYKYTYYNECKKIKVRKNKKGIITVINKSGMDTEEVKDNVQTAIQRGADTCLGAAYSR